MIEIPREVYEKFLRFALENADPSNPGQWKECIALILGRISGNNVEVIEIVPIVSGSAVFVDITDYEQVFSLIPEERIDRGEVIVGWAHTHPGLGVFFSARDVQTQLEYQRMHPQTFGLVLDPSKVTSDYSGFNIYRVNTTTAHSYIVDYTFTDQFDFLTSYNSLVHDLYEIPVAGVSGITLLEKNSVVWKNMTISISGPSNYQLNRNFKVTIDIKLPFLQFVRLDYDFSVEINGEPVLIESKLSNKLFHETISPGTLAIFNFKLREKKEARIWMRNLRIADYSQQYQDLPDLVLEMFPE